MHTLVNRLRAKWGRGKGPDRPIWPWPEGKVEFRRELTRRLDDLDQDIALLYMAVSGGAAKEETELLDELWDLRERTGRLQRALQVYGSEEGEAWQSFRSKAEARWAELRHELMHAFDGYRARHPRGPGEARTAIEISQASQAAESENGPSQPVRGPGLEAREPRGISTAIPSRWLRRPP